MALQLIRPYYCSFKLMVTFVVFKLMKLGLAYDQAYSVSPNQLSGLCPLISYM